MRQGQQNRRGRGRNRKSQNPLTRSFESTGPDVKLRGTPNHIAEKYMSLARDALSSGDPVLAENYMQHAEHYNRIIMSFREQQISQGGGDPFAGNVPRSMGGEMDAGDDFGDDEADDFGNAVGQPGMGQPMANIQSPMAERQNQPQNQSMGQPRSFDQPQRFDNRQNHQHRRDHQRHNNNHRNDRNDNRFDRQDRGQDRERQDFRGDRGERHDRNGYGGEPRGFREDRQGGQQGTNQGEPNGEGMQQPQHRRRERFQGAPQGSGGTPAEQPEFLRRPVRRPRSAEGSGEEPAPRPPQDGETE